MRIVFDADGSIFCAKVRDGKHEYRKVTCECSKKEIQESSCKLFVMFIVKLYL